MDADRIIDLLIEKGNAGKLNFECVKEWSGWKARVQGFGTVTINHDRIGPDSKLVQCIITTEDDDIAKVVAKSSTDGSSHFHLLLTIARLFSDPATRDPVDATAIECRVSARRAIEKLAAL